MSMSACGRVLEYTSKQMSMFALLINFIVNGFIIRNIVSCVRLMFSGVNEI